MRKISENQEILMLLLGEALFGREAKLPTEVDWRGVFKEAKQQSVLPLAFEAARPRLTEELAAEYSERVDKLVVNNMYMEFDHVELHACMSEAEIPYVVMKGSASAAYYPRPLLRMMGDVDFLVSREDAARAGEALKRLGFRETEERDNPIHQAYRRDDGMTHVSEWELHWSPNGIPRNESGEQIRALLADSIQTSRLLETENGAYRVPDDFHHGLMILIHTAMHLMHSGVGLRHLCDWAAYAHRFDRESFCTLFESKLRACGLWDFARALTAVCVDYLGCPDPGWTGEIPETLAGELMVDILRGGNFGKHDRQRINEAKLLVDRNRGTVRPGAALSNLFSALSVKARRSMPILEKAPILLPVGWLYVSARHLGRVLLGKRPAVHVGQTLRKAEERSALYEQLRLFEDAEE